VAGSLADIGALDDRRMGLRVAAWAGNGSGPNSALPRIGPGSPSGWESPGSWGRLSDRLGPRPAERPPPVPAPGGHRPSQDRTYAVGRGFLRQYGSTAMIGVPGSTDGLGPILFNYVTPIKKWARRVRLSGTSPCLNSVFWHGSKPPRLHHESDKRSASLALDMEGEGSYNERFPPKREGLCRVSGAGQRGLWVLLFISAPWPGGRRSSRSRRKMVE